MPRKSLQFASFTLDLERLCLRGPAGEVELRPKSFEVLRYLVEHAGRVASKEEVMAAVWSDVTVTDELIDPLHQRSAWAIGDEGQRIVKTVPRRGYLLDGPVLPRHEFRIPHQETAPTLQSQKETDPMAFPVAPRLSSCRLRTSQAIPRRTI